MGSDVSSVLRQRLHSGDRDALAEAFQSEHARLWNMIHFRMDARLMSRLDPDDVLQDAFLAAHARLSHFLNSKVSLIIWLRSIVLQTLIDLHRQHLGVQQRDASREISLQIQPAGDGTSVCLAAALSGAFTSPSHVAMRNEAHASLSQGLNQLNEREREIIALRHFELLTNSEVAEALDIQPKNASIRYVRAMMSLKTILESSGIPLNESSSYQSNLSSGKP